jgi:K+-transporting ATPase ATPase C chain
MKSVLAELLRSFVAALALTALLCVLYPFVIWAIAQVVFPWQANGSLLRGSDDQWIGSQHIGQSFDGPQYFHPRPSAAGGGYDAAHSGGSNLGPLSRPLADLVQQRAEMYRRENNLSFDARIPADAVTASASGLDPHISVENARLQAARVARERGLERAAIQRLIAVCTEGRPFGILGESGVNVLLLNLALDRKRP